MTVVYPKFSRPARALQTKNHRRALDLLLLTVSVPLWVPAIATISAAVAVLDGRPVFYGQRRTGKGGRPFTMWKFRSMKPGPNPLIPSASAITPIGGRLRRSSLDELPQLINVLAGHMSLVGPRPMLEAQAAELSNDQLERHLVRPGMTGLAQVSGRNTITWEERIELDRTWVETADIGSYLGILARTFSAVRDISGTNGHSTADPIASVSLHEISSSEAA